MNVQYENTHRLSMYAPILGKNTRQARAAKLISPRAHNQAGIARHCTHACDIRSDIPGRKGERRQVGLARVNNKTERRWGVRCGWKKRESDVGAFFPALGPPEKKKLFFSSCSFFRFKGRNEFYYVSARHSHTPAHSHSHTNLPTWTNNSVWRQRRRATNGQGRRSRGTSCGIFVVLAAVRFSVVVAAFGAAVVAALFTPIPFPVVVRYPQSVGAGVDVAYPTHGTVDIPK